MNEETKGCLTSLQFMKRLERSKLHVMDQSQTNPSIYIVIFKDGTQCNIHEDTRDTYLEELEREAEEALNP